eukprot:gene6019-6629_t
MEDPLSSTTKQVESDDDGHTGMDEEVKDEVVVDVGSDNDKVEIVSEFQAKLFKACHFLEKVVMRAEIDCLTTDEDREEVLNFFFYLKSSLNASSVGAVANLLGYHFGNTLLRCLVRAGPSSTYSHIHVVPILIREAEDENAFMHTLALADDFIDAHFIGVESHKIAYWRERLQHCIRSMLCLMFLTRQRLLEAKLVTCKSQQAFMETVFACAEDVLHPLHMECFELTDLLGSYRHDGVQSWFNKLAFWSPDEKMQKFEKLSVFCKKSVYRWFCKNEKRAVNEERNAMAREDTLLLGRGKSVPKKKRRFGLIDSSSLDKERVVELPAAQHKEEEEAVEEKGDSMEYTTISRSLAVTGEEIEERSMLPSEETAFDEPGDEEKMEISDTVDHDVSVQSNQPPLPIISGESMFSAFFALLNCCLQIGGRSAKSKLLALCGFYPEESSLFHNFLSEKHLHRFVSFLSEMNISTWNKLKGRRKAIGRTNAEIHAWLDRLQSNGLIKSFVMELVELRSLEEILHRPIVEEEGKKPHMPFLLSGRACNRLIVHRVLDHIRSHHGHGYEGFLSWSRWCYENDGDFHALLRGFLVEEVGQACLRKDDEGLFANHVAVRFQRKTAFLLDRNIALPRQWTAENFLEVLIPSLIRVDRMIRCCVTFL